MRDSFIVYRSFGKALNALPAENYVNIMKALTAYALDDIEPEALSEIETAFFELMRPQVDANNRRYENGHKGGKPKNQTVTKPEPSVQKPEPNDNDNVNDNVNLNENENLNGDSGGIDNLTVSDNPASRTKNPRNTETTPPPPPPFFNKPNPRGQSPPSEQASSVRQVDFSGYFAMAPPIAHAWEEIKAHWNTKPGVMTCEKVWLNMSPVTSDRVRGTINTYSVGAICKAIDAHFRDKTAIEKGFLCHDLYNFLEKHAERYVEV